MLFNYKNLKQLNGTELHIRDYIISHPEDILHMNVRDLADEVNVSTATLVRFTQKLGCTGFQDFKKQFEEYLEGTHIMTIDEKINTLTDELNRYKTIEYKKKINAFAKAIAESSLIIVYGIGKSEGLAIYAARSFADCGVNALPITDPYYPILKTTQRLLFISISHSGETVETIEESGKYKRSGARLACITAHADSTLAKTADILLDYQEPDIYLATTINFSSEAPVIFLIEALTSKLLEKDLANSNHAMN